jgi:hypothetical protein
MDGRAQIVRPERQLDRLEGRPARQARRIVPRIKEHEDRPPGDRRDHALDR